MRIGIVTPAPPDSRYGNRITAVRWAKILRTLGHTVSISQAYDGEPFNLLVALHARRSHSSIDSFRRNHPETPIIVALTGTDLYRDIPTNQLARKSLEIATRVVVLQPKAIDELRPRLQYKARVIYQSVDGTREPASCRAAKPRARKPKHSARFSGNFDVCVIGHLRPVKDPFRTAQAARTLPESSRIRVLQVGKAMTDSIAARARKEMLVNHRYEWLGEQPRSQVRRILARSRLCVLSSRMEGGANVLSEAIVASVPILASRIDGNVGILGEVYTGYFGVGDTKQLVELMTRAETCPEYYADLRAQITNLSPLFSVAREQQAWADLITEFHLPS
jgi:putative glycosyltransferase (TIGR04348 family)